MIEACLIWFRSVGAVGPTSPVQPRQCWPPHGPWPCWLDVITSASMTFRPSSAVAEHRWMQCPLRGWMPLGRGVESVDASAEVSPGLRTLHHSQPFRCSLAAGMGLLLFVAIQTASNSTLLPAFLMLGLMLLASLTHDSLQGLRLSVADLNRDCRFSGGLSTSGDSRTPVNACRSFSRWAP